MYSGASPISLVEHCVTFRHDRRLLLLLGFAHNWQTSRWSETKKTNKQKNNRFSLNGNGIMSFLGRQFYRSTLCVCVYIYIYIYIYISVAIGLISRVLTSGLGDQGSIPGRVIPKTQKWYLIPPCLTLSIIGYGSRIIEAIQRKE